MERPTVDEDEVMSIRVEFLRQDAGKRLPDGAAANDDYVLAVVGSLA